MVECNARSLVVAACWVGIVGCSEAAEPANQTVSSGTPTASSSGGTTTGAGSACESSGMVSAQPLNNYTFSSTLSFPLSSVAPETDLSFDWSTLTHDFLGHPLNPAADVDAMYLMLWLMTPTELEQKLNDDELRQSDLAVIAMIPTDNTLTSGSLFDLHSGAGEPLDSDEILPFVNADSYAPEQHTYTVMVASGEELGAGTRMIQAFQLDPQSLNTTIQVTDQSTALGYQVDLASAPATTLPAGESAIVFDWSGMPTNAMGAPFVLTRVTEVVIARYDRSRAELQEDFLALVNYQGDIVADEVFRADVPSGSSMDLSQLSNSAGAAFSGIDATSTWILALFCGRCRNPAPWYLTFLSPCQ